MIKSSATHPMTTTLTASDFCQQGQWFAKFSGMEKTAVTITKPDGKTHEAHGLLAIANRWSINHSTSEVLIHTLNLGTFTAPAGTTITFVKPDGAICKRVSSAR